MADRSPTRPSQTAVPHVFKPLPTGASLEQIVQALHEQGAAYATIAAGFNSSLPALKRDYEEFRVIQEAHGVRLGRLEVWRAQLAGLPSMRVESPSSNDLSKHVSEEVAARVAAEVANPSTPPPDAKKVGEITEDVMQAALAQIKSKWWDEREAERKAAETVRLELVEVNSKEKARATWKIAVACILAGISVATLLVEHLVK
jgi:hypothetical protein